MRVDEGGTGGEFSLEWLERRRQAIRPVLRDEIVGNRHAVEAADSLIWRLQNTERMAEHGAEPPRGMLLMGPPGVGKTMLARYVATRLGDDVPFYSLPLDELSPLRIRGAIEHLDGIGHRSVIYLDEIDGFARHEDHGYQATTSERNLRLAFLSSLDGPVSGRGVIVIASTNLHRYEISPALVRSGRLSVHVEFSTPTRDERFELIRRLAASRALADGVDLGYLADVSGGLSPADLVQAFDDALGVTLGRASAHDLRVSETDLTRALTRRGLMIPDRERIDPARLLRTLHHEMGHAITATALWGAASVGRIVVHDGGAAFVELEERWARAQIGVRHRLQKLVFSEAGVAADLTVTGGADFLVGSEIDRAHSARIIHEMIGSGLYPAEISSSSASFFGARTLIERRETRHHDRLLGYAHAMALRIAAANREAILDLAEHLVDRLMERPALNNAEWQEALAASPHRIAIPELDPPPLEKTCLRSFGSLIDRAEG